MEHLVEQWKENTLRLLFSADLPHLSLAPRVVTVRLLLVLIHKYQQLWHLREENSDILQKWK